MGKYTIVAADNIKGSGLDLLKKHFGDDSVVVRGKFAEAELIDKIKDFDALLVRSGTIVTRKAIEAAGSRLKLIGRAGAGTDNIDRQAATEKGIIVMNTPFGNTVSAAEQAIALIFATARNIARADALMQQHKWEKKALVGTEVFNKVLGIVGLGKIGQHVAQVMKAAGMRVLAYDPLISAQRAAELTIELCMDLDELLAKADFVTFHTPLTDKTRNLLSAARIARMKKGARVVNCARGGIVDEAALADAVKSGHLAAAGFDVFSTEPMTEGPLFGVPDITLAPHLGASTEEAEERCGLQIAQQAINYFETGRIVNAVNVTYSPDESLKAYAELAEVMGRIATRLVNSAIYEISVTLSGDFFEGKDGGAIRSSAVKGILEELDIECVNAINADYIAGQRGIRPDLSITKDLGHLRIEHVSLMVKGRRDDEEKVTYVAGTVYKDNRKRILQIDDADIEVRLDKHMLFLRYTDKPGIIGKVGTILGARSINIENMQVGILKKLNKASMVVGTSEPIPPEVLDEIGNDDLLKPVRINTVNDIET